MRKHFGEAESFEGATGFSLLGSMENIKGIISAVIGNMASRTPDLHARIESAWQNILMENARKHVKLKGIKEGTVWVEVDSPAWMHQMKIHQRKILKTLQTQISEVKSIRFIIGNFP